MAVGCGSSPDWTRNSNGTWHGPFEAYLATTPLPNSTTRSKMVERMEQVHRIHPESSLVFTVHQGVCTWVDGGYLQIVAFNGNCWVNGQVRNLDWQKALASHPMDRVAQLSKVRGIPSPVSVTRSTLRLWDGASAQLTPEWYWVEEAKGLSPETKLNRLASGKTNVPLTVAEIPLRALKNPHYRFEDTGFSSKIFTDQMEAIDGWSPRIGYGIRRPTEWVILYYSKMASATDVAAFKGLIELLREKLATPRKIGSVVVSKDPRP